MFRSLFWRGRNNCLYFIHRKYLHTMHQCRLKTFQTKHAEFKRVNYMSKSLCQRVEDSGRFHENSFVEVEDETDADFSLRTIIPYDTHDTVINSLLDCASVNEVFDVLEAYKGKLIKDHLVQTILVLWHLQHVFVKVQTQVGCINDSTENNYLNQLQNLEYFQYLLKLVEEMSGSFLIDELTCSLLYLSKMNVELNVKAMTALVDRIEEKFQENEENKTWTALSRFCVSMKFHPGLRSQLLLLNVVPFIERKIDSVESNPEDLRLLSICLLHTNHLVSQSCLQKYKNICENFAKIAPASPESLKAMIKTLSLLSLPFWSCENTSIARKISMRLKGHVAKLEIKDVVTLCKSFNSHLEPAYLLEEIIEVVRNSLNSLNPVPDKVINTNLLSCAAQFATYHEKERLEHMLYEELNSGYFSNTMATLFHILRSLKTSNKKLCDLLWSKTLDELRGNVHKRDPQKLYRAGLRYMYFNNNMGGTYRNFKFERQLISWIAEEIEFGSSSYTPRSLARGVSFLLSYCRDPEILVFAIDRLLEVKTQLQKSECVLLSRGAEIMLEINKRKKMQPSVIEKLVELDTCLNECAWRHLLENNLSHTDLTGLLRTYHNRRAGPDSLLFHTLVERFEKIADHQCSRLIRDLTYSLNGMNCLIPKLMDKMAEYIVENSDSVLAETAERVISTSFNLGYLPSSGVSFLDTCSRLLIRDISRLSSLSTIQMSLALSFFHRFPPNLVSKIFSVEFLERIDAELATCYSKATYPVRVRFTLMELNRSVCLDLPELDVPWFHAKYCEDIATLDPVLETPFHHDVRERLADILGNKKFIQTDVYSPYGYKINFLVHLDAMTRPLLKGDHSKAKQKVAVLLHSDHQFTNATRRLKGQQQMRQRHLEMMGYRVIPIAEQTWNAMFITESHAKKSFLSDKLWPER